MEPIEKIMLIRQHMQRVEANMFILIAHYIKISQGFALELAKRARSHDLSKFSLLEFINLTTDSDMFEPALREHRRLNSHHPEYYGDIHEMEIVDVAEMVCDWMARSQEFGTGIRDWIETVAMPKYNFIWEDDIGVEIDKYIKILTKNHFKTELIDFRTKVRD